eukprot:1158519-Pelagomonas_calceolata.AAC.2
MHRHSHTFSRSRPDIHKQQTHDSVLGPFHEAKHNVEVNKSAAPAAFSTAALITGIGQRPATFLYSTYHLLEHQRITSVTLYAIGTPDECVYLSVALCAWIELLPDRGCTLTRPFKSREAAGRAGDKNRHETQALSIALFGKDMKPRYPKKPKGSTGDDHQCGLSTRRALTVASLCLRKGDQQPQNNMEASYVESSLTWASTVPELVDGMQQRPSTHFFVVSELSSSQPPSGLVNTARARTYTHIHTRTSRLPACAAPARPQQRQRLRLCCAQEGRSDHKTTLIYSAQALFGTCTLVLGRRCCDGTHGDLQADHGSTKCCWCLWKGLGQAHHEGTYFCWIFGAGLGHLSTFWLQCQAKGRRHTQSAIQAALCELAQSGSGVPGAASAGGARASERACKARWPHTLFTQTTSSFHHNKSEMTLFLLRRSTLPTLNLKVSFPTHCASLSSTTSGAAFVGLGEEN